MAKFKIEVELDWLEDEVNLDETLKEEIFAELRSKVTRNAEKELTSKIEELLASKMEEVSTKITDEFIEKTLNSAVENLKIPYKENSWKSEVEYIPLSEFIGMRYEHHLNRKVYDYQGNIPRYDSDKKLSINEYLINKYLEKELTSKVSELIQTAREDAEETIIKTLECNLKEQLSVDIIKRLNIPNLLKNLQDKAELLDNK